MPRGACVVKGTEGGRRRPTPGRRHAPHARLDWDNIVGIDLDRGALAQDAHGNDEPCLAPFAEQNTADSFQRAPADLDGHSRNQGGVRVHREGAGDQAPNRLDLDIRNWHSVKARSEHLDHAKRGQHPQALLPGKPRETVSGKEWELNTDFTVFPPAPPADEGEEHLDPPAFELGPDPLFMTRACADSVPAGF